MAKLRQINVQICLLPVKNRFEFSFKEGKMESTIFPVLILK